MGLQVKVLPDMVTFPHEEEVHEVYRVSISGTIAVPRNDMECRLVARVFDDSEDLDGEKCYPVVCHIPDLCDENGFFLCEQSIKVPYELSTVTELPVAVIPKSSLAFPKRGRRRAIVFVGLRPNGGQAKMYCHGETYLYHLQEFFGYLEREKIVQHADTAIVGLAMCVCAADGKIDRRESSLIRGHFAGLLHNADSVEAETRKRAINTVIKRFHEKVYLPRRNARPVWERACEKILELGSENVAHEAYELCVKLVAADQCADPTELSVLVETARRLRIPAELDATFRDRYIKGEHYSWKNDGAGLGMPDGLTREEQVAWLNNEYQKWRRRATHNDQKIASDAQLRLQRIMKIRNMLEG